MNFQSKVPADTLAALQVAQLIREKQLKEEARTVATRVIDAFAMKKDWPPEDTNEVLCALGLRTWTE